MVLLLFMFVIALEDLSNELAKLGFKMPPNISLQFDNCGENKVLFIFKNLKFRIEFLLYYILEQIRFYISQPSCRKTILYHYSS